MEEVQYVRKKILEYDRVDLSEHARRRAKLRGIKPDKIVENIKKANILGVRPNDNPNVDISYSETYLILIKSDTSEHYYIPIYFLDDCILVTTVLKLSESNTDLLEW